MAMGEMRRGVAVPRQASIGDGGGHVSMVSGRLLSLFKVFGLYAICVADSGRVDVSGRL